MTFPCGNKKIPGEISFVSNSFQILVSVSKSFWKCQDRTGNMGQDRTGQDRTGQGTGQWTEQGRTGQGRAGQDRKGQDRTGQDRA